MSKKLFCPFNMPTERHSWRHKSLHIERCTCMKCYKSVFCPWNVVLCTLVKKKIGHVEFSPVIPITLYIRRLKVGVKRLQWSFCLVWRPSSEECPGPSCPLISRSTQLLVVIGLTVSKLVFNSLLSSVWTLGNTVLLKCHHPYPLAQSSYIHLILQIRFLIYFVVFNHLGKIFQFLYKDFIIYDEAA